MAAIMRVVSGVGGSTVLDLNGTVAGGVVNARGDKVLAQTTLTQDQISGDQGLWWTPLVNPSEVAERRIQIPLTVFGTADDIGARVSAVQAAVDTPWVLEVRRHGATQSGWLRCQPATVQVQAGINSVDSADRRGASVVLSALTEPYALGAAVDTGDLTFSQDTSSGSALFADVNSVPGDALAPTLIRYNLATPVGASLTTHGSWWAVRRQSPQRPTPSNLTGLVVQGEASTATSTSGANVTTSVPTGDTALAGNSSRRFTFGAGATVNDFGEASYTFSQSGVDANGRYRVLGRFRRGGGGAGIQHAITPAFGAYTAQTYTFPAGGVDTRIIDLGLIQLPAGQAPTIAAPLTSARGASMVGARIIVAKNGAAGAGTFDIDWLALIPADEDAGFWRIAQDTAMWAFADGYALEPGFSTTDPLTGVSPTLVGAARSMGNYWTGGIPRLGPGSNRVYCVQGVTGAVVWPKTQSVVARIAYWPRYRWIP